MAVLGTEVDVGLVVFVLLATWLGGVAQSTLGFGAAFATVPALALAAPELLPGSMVVAVLPLSVTMVALGRRHLDGRALARLTVGRLPGIVVGALIVAALPVRGLTVLIALALLAAVASSAVGWELAVTDRRELAAGFLSGLTGTAVALGGPPLALLYRGREGAVVRPTLAAVWAIGGVPTLIGLALVGEFTRAQAQAGAALSGVLLIGLWTGASLVKRVADDRLRLAVLWWAALGAVLALWRAVAG